MTASADIIDLLAGVSPGDALDEVRSHRPQARENAQRSFAALLEPDEAGTFPLAERYAIASFVARLHESARAVAFYDDLLADEAPDLVDPVSAAAREGRSNGPYGVYREPELTAESVPGPAFEPSEQVAAALGDRLTAAFAHTHLLVFRPREAAPDALSELESAGWSTDEIVTLSQLVSFLAFQLRSAWGLQVLAGRDPRADGSIDPETEGTAR